jgi:prevent-host-death family protein
MGHRSTVSLAEAKNKLSELLDRVSRGEEFTITRHNTEIARLVPIKRPPGAEIADAIASMRATRKARRATLEEIQQWRNEGRR